MYKVIFILSVVIVSAGCSVFQKAERSEYKSSGEANWNTIEKLVVKQNLTTHNFFINKARIGVVTNDVKESFLATIKFIYPDTFLVSLRSKTGIEAARIFFTNDTIWKTRRCYLLFSIGLSFVYPFFSIESWLQSQPTMQTMVANYALL